MRDLEVWPSGKKSGSDTSGGNQGGSKQAKPKLLIELESYVGQQLFLIEEKDPSVFDADRFQVYRNVFQFFIDKLHTYRPLFSIIKMEYELLLEESMRRMQDVKPFKARHP